MQYIEPRLRSTSHHPHLDLHLQINLTVIVSDHGNEQTLRRARKNVFSRSTPLLVHITCDYPLSHSNCSCSLCKYVSIVGLVSKCRIVSTYMCLPKICVLKVGYWTYTYEERRYSLKGRSDNICNIYGLSASVTDLTIIRQPNQTKGLLMVPIHGKHCVLFVQRGL